MTTRHMCYIVEDQSQVAQREESSFTKKKKKKDANQVLQYRYCVFDFHLSN
jgi:hypothetical protein